MITARSTAVHGKLAFLETDDGQGILCRSIDNKNENLDHNPSIKYDTDVTLFDVKESAADCTASCGVSYIYIAEV